MVFEVKPLTTLTKVKPSSKIPEPLPQPGKICWTLLSRRRGGKSTMLANSIKVYSKDMSEIIVISSTVFIDPIWKSVANLKNVSFGDQVNNEIPEKILQRQKERFMQDPKGSSILLVVDDSGNLFRSKHLRAMMNVLYTTFRHYNGNLICAVQSMQHLEGTQITNSSQWCIWQSDARQLKKICTDLATAHMDSKALETFIKESTKEKYNFAFVDFTDEKDEDVFRKNFT